MMAIWLAEGPPQVDRSRAVIFLDRDGVVIRDQDYLKSPQGVEVLAGVPAAMRRAAQAGYRLIGVSNQSGIGRGYFTEVDFTAVMEKLAADLAADGAGFDAFFYCPHGPEEACHCRKPAPGLLVEAAAGGAWDADRSWMIGDKASDIAFARDAGLNAVLVRTGYGSEAESAVRRRWADDACVRVADDLPAAVTLILGVGPPTGSDL